MKLELIEDDNPILRMIPPQIKITPEMNAEVKKLFKGTHFDCPECGGDLIPFNLEEGVCFQCKEVATLADCNYETDEEEITEE